MHLFISKFKVKINPDSENFNEWDIIWSYFHIFSKHSVQDSLTPDSHKEQNTIVSPKKI